MSGNYNGYTNADTYGVVVSVHNIEPLYTWLREQIASHPTPSAVAQKLADHIRSNSVDAQIPTWVDLDNVNWDEIVQQEIDDDIVQQQNNDA